MLIEFAALHQNFGGANNLEVSRILRSVQNRDELTYRTAIANLTEIRTRLDAICEDLYTTMRIVESDKTPVDADSLASWLFQQGILAESTYTGGNIWAVTVKLTGTAHLCIVASEEEVLPPSWNCHYVLNADRDEAKSEWEVPASRVLEWVRMHTAKEAK